VIQRCTDINLRDAWVVWCACGYESLPYIDLEVAQMMAWRHTLGWRISDLRIDLDDDSSCRRKQLFEGDRLGSGALCQFHHLSHCGTHGFSLDENLTLLWALSSFRSLLSAGSV
jgi:hypothetical protein